MLLCGLNYSIKIIYTQLFILFSFIYKQIECLRHLTCCISVTCDSCFSDPAGTLCHRSLNPPRGSVTKPQCEINPFLPQPSSLDWVSSLTESGLSPVYLQAEWFSSAFQGLNEQLGISTITRAPTGSKEHSGNDLILTQHIYMWGFTDQKIDWPTIIKVYYLTCVGLTLFPQ